MPPDLRARVEAVVRELAPELGLDPTAVAVPEVSDGVASVRLGPGCGCGASLMAIVTCLEQQLRERVPEIEVVEALP